MKKINCLSVFSLFLLLAACGPAAEDRQAMHSRAKVFQDSLANVIRTTIAEAEGPAPQAQPQPQTADTASQRIKAIQTATVK